MVRRIVLVVIALAILGGVAFYLLTIPRTLAAADLPPHEPDLANGEAMFWAGGCDSCHAAENARGDDRLKLGGGRVLATAFGTFHPPNISPDPDHGIGGWSLADFVTAMKLGVSPGGVHLYPSFPYASYQRMRVEDITDLKAFLDTLPAVATPNVPHDLPFPLTVRRGIGLWKLLHVDGASFTPDPAASDAVNRGAYLVEGPGHCGECHTPRGFDGAMIANRALSGGPSPEGRGSVPNITPHPDGIGDWSEDDIVMALTTGMMPDGDTFGGSMVEVQENLSRLSTDDISAIAAYLKSIPPIPGRP